MSGCFFLKHGVHLVKAFKRYKQKYVLASLFGPPGIC